MLYLRRVKVNLILTCMTVFFTLQANAFFVALDPNSINLDTHSAHEELTRQAYNELMLKHRAAGQDHSPYLEGQLDALYNISRGVYATDVPNGNYPISLPTFWNFPTDIVEWHRNPMGQHLHSLRNKIAATNNLETAGAACYGIHKDIDTVAGRAFDCLMENKVSEYLFLIGHGLHVLQDSFSAAHTRRQTSGSYNLIDICYYGSPLATESACFHEENDPRDSIWLTESLGDQIFTTEKEWLHRGEKVYAFSDLAQVVLADVPEDLKGTYLKNEARLAKVASMRYLDIALNVLLSSSPTLSFGAGSVEQRKNEFLKQIQNLLEVPEKAPDTAQNDESGEIMSRGVMNCQSLAK